MNKLAEIGAALIGAALRHVEAIHGGDLSAILRIELSDGREAIVKNGPAPKTEAVMLRAIAATRHDGRVDHGRGADWGCAGAPDRLAAPRLNILWTGYRMLRESVGSLMDEVADPDAVAELRRIISNHADGAIEAHDVRTRTAGSITFIEFHLVVSGRMAVTRR